ncbi:hypothetical protein LCGC14_3091190 [marine sediment metagenome]|uniref:Uncharacterized protein n=1 Tax=marine sediment metagenome TaxID=412755 RepID=A0A0F8WZ84_9ZZZZ
MSHIPGHLDATPGNPEDFPFIEDIAPLLAQFEKTFNLPTGIRTPYQKWVADRFQDVVSNYALKQAGLFGFTGDVQGGRRGRNFQEELDLLVGSEQPFGAGFRTNRNLAAISGLTEEGELDLRNTLEGAGFNPQDILNRSFLNASQARLGSLFGGGLALRETSPAATRQFGLTPEFARGGSFLQPILQRLREQFGLNLAGPPAR